MMALVEPVGRAHSPAWDAGEPDVSVVVATHDRAAFLGGLLDALAGQDFARHRFEVVIVDDGSPAAAWRELVARVEGSPLAAVAVRVPHQGGPSIPRNVGVHHARALIVAFTDDDCLPSSGWLSALWGCFSSGADLVQGPVEPESGRRPGPWHRSIWVVGPSPLFETANLACRKATFLEVGGFPVGVLLRGQSRHRGFGEDAITGDRMARRGRRAWASEAVVVHRWLPGGFGDHLRNMRRLEGFPGLLLEAPSVQELLWHRWFLTKRTAAYDLAVVGLVIAASGAPAGFLASAPWMVLAIRDARARGRIRQLPWRLVQLAMADSVAAFSLARGSARAGRLVM
jgi:glycosyltransferase involved in cell wall biosynthesis